MLCNPRKLCPALLTHEISWHIAQDTATGPYKFRQPPQQVMGEGNRELLFF
jgi:hypothetical protein